MVGGAYLGVSFKEHKYLEACKGVSTGTSLAIFDDSFRCRLLSTCIYFIILFIFLHQALTKEPEFVAEDEFEESDLSDIEV